MRAAIKIVLSGVLMGACVCMAQQVPKASNAKLDVRSGGALQTEIAQVSDVAWIGYAIQTVRPVNGDQQKEYLEGGSHEDLFVDRPEAASAPWANVLLRVAGGRVQKVTLQPAERELDAGGLRLVWINGVSPADSIRTMKGLAEAESKAVAGPPVNRDVDRDHERLLEHALMVLAQTNAPEATSALRGFTAASYPANAREKAAFWLADSRGSEGYAAIAELLKTEKDDALREKLVFDLTLVRGNSRHAAMEALLVEVKEDASVKVRGKAQFWLAQMAANKIQANAGVDPRIAATLGDEARNDPNASLRKSAVFALSRMPDDQGIPKLIEVANTAPDVATRREAIFWLGQKKDSRALAYLEKIVRQ